MLDVNNINDEKELQANGGWQQNVARCKQQVASSQQPVSPHPLCLR